jgi:hypothetical protein
LSTEGLELLHGAIISASQDVSCQISGVKSQARIHNNQVTGRLDEITSTLQLLLNNTKSNALDHAQKADDLVSSFRRNEKQMAIILESMGRKGHSRGATAQSSIENLSDRIEASPSTSHAQSSTLQDLISVMRTLQLETREVRRAMLPLKMEMKSTGSQQVKPLFQGQSEIHASLQKCMGRLCGLATERSVRVNGFSTRSQSIVDDLSQILDFMLQGEAISQWGHDALDHKSSLLKIRNISQVTQRFQKKEQGQALFHKTLFLLIFYKKPSLADPNLK